MNCNNLYREFNSSQEEIEFLNREFNSSQEEIEFLMLQEQIEEMDLQDELKRLEEEEYNKEKISVKEKINENSFDNFDEQRVLQLLKDSGSVDFDTISKGLQKSKILLSAPTADLLLQKFFSSRNGNLHVLDVCFQASPMSLDIAFVFQHAMKHDASVEIGHTILETFCTERMSYDQITSDFAIYLHRKIAFYKCDQKKLTNIVDLFFKKFGSQSITSEIMYQILEEFESHFTKSQSTSCAIIEEFCRYIPSSSITASVIEKALSIEGKLQAHQEKMGTYLIRKLLKNAPKQVLSQENMQFAIESGLSGMIIYMLMNRAYSDIDKNRLFQSAEVSTADKEVKTFLEQYYQSAAKKKVTHAEPMTFSLQDLVVEIIDPSQNSEAKKVQDFFQKNISDNK